MTFRFVSNLLLAILGAVLAPMSHGRLDLGHLGLDPNRRLGVHGCLRPP
ncbi:MAG: hypothetical protein JO027_01500 [Solirubrobacterales bacterium]|nr:hypothetical protein [Solirubrobacterales bacterium]